MSYLYLPSFTGLTSGLGSVFFRVDQTALDAAVTRPYSSDSLGDGSGNFWPPLQRIIPLMMFGSAENILGSAKYYAGQGPIDPCYLGINCNQSQPTLCANLQTNGSTSWDPDTLYPELAYRPPGFFMGGYGGGGETCPVQGDRWHHAAFSFNLSGSCAMHHQFFAPTNSIVSTGPRFNWSFNGQDKTNASLVPGGDAFGANSPDILMSGGAQDAWGSADIVNHEEDDHFPNDGITITQSGTIASGSFGIPVTPTYSTRFFGGAIIADIRFYANVYEQVSGLTNLFIADDGTPADPAIAFEFFGRVPDVHFKAADDFISGTNTGSAGNFTVVGRVDKTNVQPKIGA